MSLLWVCHWPQLLGNLRAVWGAAHSWTAPAGGDNAKQVVVLDAFEDPVMVRMQIRLLFEETLAALVSYFDVERVGR